MAIMRLCVRDDRWTKKGNKVQIALAHNGSTVYIATPVVLTSAKQWRNGRVVNHERAVELNRILNDMLCDYERHLDAVRDVERYSCRELRDVMMGKRQARDVLTFDDVIQEYIAELREDGREGYAIVLGVESRRFARAVGEVMMEGITPKLINNYCRWLMRQGFAAATVSIALRNVRTIVNRAIRLQYVRYDVHPFTGVRIPNGAIREIDIDVETLNKIRCAEIDIRRLAMARDLFMLSFYCGGMNMADIVRADWRRERVEYVREKTKNRMQSVQRVSIVIAPEAREIVDRYIGDDGRLDFGYKYTYRNFTTYVSRLFRRLMGELGIEGVIMYSARKTWAQMAMELGVSESTIDYCLGHSDSRRGIIRYYTKVRSRMADDAIRMVIDYVMGRIE